MKLLLTIAQGLYRACSTHQVYCTGSSLSPSTSCIPEKWQKMLWYKFWSQLPILTMSGDQPYLFKTSKHCIACLPCNSSRSPAGRPQWPQFKLHLDLSLPPRAEQICWTSEACEEPNLQGTDGEVYRPECSGGADLRKGRALGTTQTAWVLWLILQALCVCRARVSAAHSGEEPVEAGGSFSALPRETQSNSDTGLGEEGEDVQAGTMLHISQNTTPQPPSFLL